MNISGNGHKDDARGASLGSASRGGSRGTRRSLIFQRFANRAARAMGHPRAFIVAVTFILAWIAAGPVFGFSTHWQLVISTGTMIVTFLMVFLIQNTQNRDSTALQVKVDELIRATDGAHKALLHLEALDEAVLERIQAHYEELAEIARHNMQEGLSDTEVVEIDFHDDLSETELVFRAQRILKRHRATGTKEVGGLPRNVAAPLIPSRLAPDSPAVSALKRLIAGNRRYASGTPRHPNRSIQHRRSLVSEQIPIAAILGCADARVPPDIIFDRGVGDLFTVRVAGNVVDETIENSLEFAVEQLGVPLIVVLGHQNCGAIQAAVAAVAAGENGTGNSFVQAIAPVAREAATRDGDPVENTVRDNIFLSIDRLRAGEVLSRHVETGTLQIVGAYYHLDTGEVDFLDE